MPARNRSREEAKARRQVEDEQSSTSSKTSKAAKAKKSRKRGTTKAGKGRTGKGTAKPGSGSGGGARRTGPMLDPSAAEDAEVRYVMPGEATKTYLCPGCNRDIPPGLGHMVAVPPGEPDLRRHWHRGCWNNRHNRF